MYIWENQRTKWRISVTTFDYRMRTEVIRLMVSFILAQAGKPLPTHWEL
jgi:hypothetical protein